METRYSTTFHARALKFEVLSKTQLDVCSHCIVCLKAIHFTLQLVIKLISDQKLLISLLLKQHLHHPELFVLQQLQLQRVPSFSRNLPQLLLRQAYPFLLKFLPPELLYLRQVFPSLSGYVPILFLVLLLSYVNLANAEPLDSATIQLSFLIWHSLNLFSIKAQNFFFWT